VEIAAGAADDEHFGQGVEDWFRCCGWGREGRFRREGKGEACGVKVLASSFNSEEGRYGGGA
jgi:hypothetical protein